jgi:hypothetical protein
MSDPINPFESEQRRDANPTRSADPIQPTWLTDPYANDRYLAAEEPAAVVHQERLFSRRVLFGWAFATLVVVFAVTVILPMVVPRIKQTVIERVVGRMEQRGVRINVNGHTIEPVIPEIPEIPAIPAVPAVPAVPTVPAVRAIPGSSHNKQKPAPVTSDRR